MLCFQRGYSITPAGEQTQYNATQNPVNTGTSVQQNAVRLICTKRTDTLCLRGITALTFWDIVFTTERERKDFIYGRTERIKEYSTERIPDNN